MNGQELARRRKALKLNQTELAELWGITRQTVSDWENERARIPKMADMALRYMEAAADQESPRTITAIAAA